jgi:Holliday junction resolvase RusA-like endonuclease
MEQEFIVPGEPRGKGRPRFQRNGRPYTDNETAAYERKIAAYWHRACGAFKWPREAFLEVTVIAYLPIPKGASKVMQARMEAHEVLPSRKPDVDNVAKVVLDALNGVAYHDDARVQRLNVSKYYAREPGLWVGIREVRNDGMDRGASGTSGT